MDDFTDVIFKSVNCKGILITDGEGIIIQVEDSFEKMYGTYSSTLVGHSVYELEKEGVFRPSCVALVLESGAEATTIQRVQREKEIMVTGFPVLDDGGNIVKVVTFARDISEYNKFKALYDELTLKIDFYSRSIEELSYENTVIEEFYTNDPQFKKILETIFRVAKYDVAMLILGETGTGKTMIAKKIHKLSRQSTGKFVEINCGAMPEGLIESELFGYEKGSFTGGHKDGKAGLFETAENGTLFLDEISELPLQAQVKLLSVLQDKEVRRVGGTESRKVECRIIAATNRDLDEEVKVGRFRQDLLYRLNMLTVTIPPLRERHDDMLYLSKSILKKYNEKYEKKKTFNREVMNIFMRYSWPGNVRELDNVVHRMMITTDEDVITKDALPNFMEVLNRDNTDKCENELTMLNITDLEVAMETYEGKIIRAFAKKYGSSVKVAEALNIGQTTAARKIKKYGTSK